MHLKSVWSGSSVSVFFPIVIYLFKENGFSNKKKTCINKYKIRIVDYSDFMVTLALMTVSSISYVSVCVFVYTCKYI